MDLAPVIEAATEEFKQKLRQQCQDLNLERLTPALAEQLSGSLKQALSAAGVAGFRPFLQGYEEEAPTLEIGGSLYRWKRDSAKRFLTPSGRWCWHASCISATTAGRPWCPWIGAGAWKGSLPRWRSAKRGCFLVPW